MNKTEIEYTRQRIEQVVRCTNGTISSKLNTYLIDDNLSTQDKIEMIRKGKATLLPDHIIADDRNWHNRIKAIEECFEFPLTSEQKQKIKYNERIKDQIDSLHHEIELAGNRILDDVVLGVIEKIDVPAELEKLGEMIKNIVPPKPFKALKSVGTKKTVVKK